MKLSMILQNIIDNIDESMRLNTHLLLKKSYITIITI